MPKVVDHEARRQELAAALWRIARRDGIDHISVRAVAAEAGTSPGALRHYFASQDELAAFALQAVLDAATDRLARALPTLSGRSAAIAIVEQFLPLDAARRAEIAVYLAFLGRPDPGGAPGRIRARAESRSREGVVLALEHLRAAGLLHADRALDAEVDALYPLLDGLALHGTLFPRRYPPAHLRRVAHRALDGLAQAPRPAATT